MSSGGWPPDADGRADAGLGAVPAEAHGSYFDDIVSRGSPVHELGIAGGRDFLVRRCLQDMSELLVLPPWGEHVMVYQLGGSPSVRRFDGDRLVGTVERARLATVVAAGRPSSWQTDAEVDVVHVALDSDALARFAETEGDVDGVEIVDRTGRADPFMDSFVPTLLHELRPGAGAGLLMDALANVFAAHLLREHSNRPVEGARLVETSPRRRERAAVRRACAHLDERIGTGVGLAELAAHVGLSPYHFQRTFKRELGLSPHRYLTEKRLEIARQRLARSDEPIVDIALECGFSSQAHMTSTFTRQLGVSPGRYRKERRR